MYFGKSKINGNYTFAFDEGSLNNPVFVSNEQHKEIFRNKGDKRLSADENGFPILVDPPAHIYTEEERLRERVFIHANTDNDYAKYSRQVRLGIDVEHSQAVLDYIDQYNQQVSDTVNQEGFPQEVTYPEYVLP